MKEKVIMSWSGGKDSSLALNEIKKNSDYEITALLTTTSSDYDRISMHGVRRVLLEKQAESLDIPLDVIPIPKSHTLEEYGMKMQEALERHAKAGVTGVVFGDIFLEDLKKYREDNLAKVQMKGIFPIWKRNTSELAKTFTDLGFRAVITTIDSKVLDKSFVSREFDKDFCAELPLKVDPCGENGEFHSFVYDGPIFKEPISHKKGEIVFRENRFYYCDLIPD